MKIGVVGTFIRDRILPWEGKLKGKPVESIGGIFFTVSFLANLLDSSAEICPVCFVGEDFYDEVVEQLAVYDNVRFSGIKILPRQNTQVTLTYTSPQDREEITTPPMPALGYEELSLLEDAHAIEVNLITGADVDLMSLKKFRQQSNSLIYLDFHSHALGISPEGKRFYQRPKDWEEWINLADVLQLNEMEARTLAGYSRALPKEILLNFGKEILQKHPFICHITLAEKGSYGFFKINNRVQVKRFKAEQIAPIVDMIGCGDAFAAGFLVNYLSTKDVIEATKFANKVAGRNCTFVGSSGIKEIQELLQGNKLKFKFYGKFKTIKK
ncbi:MAG: carbohydrate kinase family protein [bacterium]